MGTDRIQDEATDDPSRQGVTPRAVADIFARLKQAEQDANGALTFTAKVSYVEIYNEEIRDLLNPEGNKKLEIKGNSGAIQGTR